jgi:phospholipase C
MTNNARNMQSRNQGKIYAILSVLGLGFFGMVIILRLTMPGWSKPAQPHPADLTAIQHIVYLIKENRTFDIYFGTFPGANGATTGKISTGQIIPLGRLPDTVPHDLDHTWTGAITAMDGGKMDRFDLIAQANENGEFLSYRQFTRADIPNYWAYAQNFVLADNMFSSLEGPSFPNRCLKPGDATIRRARQ